MFSLGIEDVDTSELDRVASSPDNVFTVDSYEDLDSKVKDIKRGLCIGIVDFLFFPGHPCPYIKSKQCFLL